MALSSLVPFIAHNSLTRHTPQPQNEAVRFILRCLKDVADANSQSAPLAADVAPATLATLEASGTHGSGPGHTTINGASCNNVGGGRFAGRLKASRAPNTSGQLDCGGQGTLEHGTAWLEFPQLLSCSTARRLPQIDLPCRIVRRPASRDAIHGGAVADAPASTEGARAAAAMAPSIRCRYARQPAARSLHHGKRNSLFQFCVITILARRNQCWSSTNNVSESSRRAAVPSSGRHSHIPSLRTPISPLPHFNTSNGLAS